MNDLRALLGDKYDDTIEKARLAIEDELIEYRDMGIFVPNNNGLTVNDRDGSHNGIRRMSTAMGVETALAAVLPDLLAEANTRADEAEAKARRFANLLGNNAKALNDVLPREVLRQKAEAWDEGHHAGHEDARAVQPTYPDPTPNPYRRGTEGDPK